MQSIHAALKLYIMKYSLCVCMLLFAFAKAYAQGPPITADKPIMLGGGSFTTKTLIEYRDTERLKAFYVPVMLHYLPTSNSLVALHLPYISYDIKEGPSGNDLADIKLLGKYQFYRRTQPVKHFVWLQKLYKHCLPVKNWI